MHPSLLKTDHRPWPLETSPWIISMCWERLLFAHWPIDAEILRDHIPKDLEIDLFQGQAWIAVVPFEMSGVRLRLTPSMHKISKFPELNVRTYVKAHNKPGVWFFSLDAGSKLAVRVARATFNLPYFDAKFSNNQENETISYHAIRTHNKAESAELKIKYSPEGGVFYAEPGSLEYWLTERYCLYSANKAGRVFRAEVHHHPWPLQQAKAEIIKCDMTRFCGASLLEPPANLLYADKLIVSAWAPKAIN